jgi:hypothetical protein
MVMLCDISVNRQMQFPYHFSGLYLLAPVDNFRYLVDISKGGCMEDKKLQPFLVRLRPATRKLLDQASQAEGRSRASLIDEALLAHLRERYDDVDSRLDSMLGQPR